MELNKKAELIKERDRLENELKKIEIEEQNKPFLNAPERINKIEEALTELQGYIKQLWKEVYSAKQSP